MVWPVWDTLQPKGCKYDQGAKIIVLKFWPFIKEVRLIMSKHSFSCGKVLNYCKYCFKILPRCTFISTAWHSYGSSGLPNVLGPLAVGHSGIGSELFFLLN